MNGLTSRTPSETKELRSYHNITELLLGVRGGGVWWCVGAAAVAMVAVVVAVCVCTWWVVGRVCAWVAAVAGEVVMVAMVAMAVCVCVCVGGG